MSLDEDTKFLTGTGGGAPRGILSGRDGEAYIPAAGIAMVNSGGASALTGDGLLDLVYELAAQYLANSVMIGAKSSFAAIRKLKNAVSGDYLWQPGLSKGAPPTVLGYDYLMNEFLQSVAAERYPLIFGDLRGYMIVDRVGMTVERVTDATTTGKNKVAIFGRRRLGGDVIEPWRMAAQKVAA
jgi:HK97 family phage major capsid protein